jgi:hypothetical protein
VYGGRLVRSTHRVLICSPIELDTDGAILLRQDWEASWASFHGSRGHRRVLGGEVNGG